MTDISDTPSNYLTYYQGPVTDHFNGKHFYNPWNPRPKKGFLDMLRWRFTEERSTWPLTIVNRDQEALSDAPLKGIKATFIGHATFLIQMNGLNILVDPVFSDRASPFSSVGPRRVAKPFVAMETLPPIDVVFVSHNHYDHMDLPSIAWLARNRKPLIVTPLGNPRIMQDCADGCRIVALDWHDSVTIGNGITLTITPAQHWSRRGMYDINRDLWGGCFLKNEDGQSLYFTGDTGFHDKMFEDIQARHGSPDIALIPIGAYEPRWFMKYSHMNPEDAVLAHKILGAKSSMAFHFETFQMTNEAFGAPREDLAKALDKHHVLHEQFLAPYPGQSVQLV